MQKLCMAAMGAAFLALGTVDTPPAAAALLNFRLTTESSNTASFTLDTETAPDSEPAVFAPGLTGFVYPNAISNFSLSAPYATLTNVSADWVIAPTFTSDLLGLPPNLGVYSGIVYPVGCVGTTFACSVSVGVIYSGDLSNLSVLSPDPSSYPIVLAVELFDPTTRELIVRESVTQYQIVPESVSNLSILAFGFGSAGLLLKRKLNGKLLTV